MAVITTLLNKNKTLYILSLKLGITILAFYFVAHKIDLDQLMMIRIEKMRMLIIAIYAAIVLVFFQALRWHFVLRALTIYSTFRKDILSVWSGHFLNNILPTSAAGDFVRSYTLRYRGADQGRWLGAFFAEKFSAMVTALFLAIISSFMEGLDGMHAEVKIMVVVVFVFSFIGIFILGLFIRVGNKIISKRILDFLSKIYFGIINVFSTSSGWAALVTSFIINMGMCLIFYVTAKAMGVALYISHCFFVVPVFSVFASLPISYAGWGVRELSSIHLFGLLGVGSEQALAMTVLYGVIILLSSLPGLFSIRAFVAAVRESRAAYGLADKATRVC
ncbi:MAG TPA: lysylphosphatidylglycerol synthase transmembrane domain-containing protein [Gammaproteobacteria bacterium]|nr:lysylphosphatidylglycerol synthase transmembrane domain-containing protein [Gammaproteobacteria bacterium]